MSQEKTTITNSASFALASIVKDYFQLIKFTLSFLVVFSTVISYLLGTDYRNSWDVLLLFFAGMLITGSANTINQVAEKDTDALMKRTGQPACCERQDECGTCHYFCNCYRCCRVVDHVAQI
jgi:heme O synthase-like polyprenyltransferase